MAYDLVGAERPNALAELLRHAEGYYPVLRELRRIAAPGKPMFKGIDVASARAIIVDVLRALLARDVRAVAPSAQVLLSTDPLLEQLSCVDGTFIAGTAYGAHPLNPTTFIPLSAFHTYLLAEKRGEFMAIVSALGASELALSDAQSSRERSGADAGLRELTGQAQLGVKAGQGSGSAAAFDLSAHFGPPRGPIGVPDGMRWVRREPMWQRMIDERLQRNILSLEVEFTYASDFSINASLAAVLEEVGIGLGGTFEASETLRQTYRVVFHERT
ncbi:MAG: hypothetical protein K1X94_01850 [Sandaracinaceae bacterium]|nr:hypothetical protein [Sandaracinaceae bacterium]